MTQKLEIAADATTADHRAARAMDLRATARGRTCVYATARTGILGGLVD
ncbi:hypothetical protein [Saccharothrix variisporea]|nr:hypothetical protein [Saccharothrix variisporea]